MKATRQDLLSYPCLNGSLLFVYPAHRCPDPHAINPNAGTADVSFDHCTCDLGYTNVTDADGNAACSACARGHFKGQVGKQFEQCTACPSNSNTTDTGAVSIIDCFCNIGYEGSIVRKNTGRCKRCPRGTFKDQLGSFDCDNCPQGQYLNPDDVASSDACSA